MVKKSYLEFGDFSNKSIKIFVIGKINQNSRDQLISGLNEELGCNLWNDCLVGSGAISQIYIFDDFLRFEWGTSQDGVGFWGKRIRDDCVWKARI